MRLGAPRGGGGAVQAPAPAHLDVFAGASPVIVFLSLRCMMYDTYHVIVFLLLLYVTAFGTSPGTRRS